MAVTKSEFWKEFLTGETAVWVRDSAQAEDILDAAEAREIPYPERIEFLGSMSDVRDGCEFRFDTDTDMITYACGSPYWYVDYGGFGVKREVFWENLEEDEGESDKSGDPPELFTVSEDEFLRAITGEVYR